MGLLSLATGFLDRLIEDGVDFDGELDYFFIVLRLEPHSRLQLNPTYKMRLLSSLGILPLSNLALQAGACLTHTHSLRFGAGFVLPIIKTTLSSKVPIGRIGRVHRAR